MKKLLGAACIGLCCLVSAQCPAQVFLNLDFELADTSTVGSTAPGVYYIYASNAIPSWTAGYGDGRVEPAPLYNSLRATTAGQVGLYDDSSSSWLPAPLQGSYSVFLSAGHGDPFGGEGSGDSFISQTGWVPSGARSVHFTTSNGGVFEGWDDPYELTLSLDGQVIPYVEIATDESSRTFAGDASSFAGDTVELRFYLHNLNPAPDAGIVLGLDNLLFSTESIPEPSTSSLLGMGIVMFLTAKWMGRSQAVGEPAVGANALHGWQRS